MPLIPTGGELIKHFGFTWVLEITIYSSPPEHGEVQFVSQESGRSGNSAYYVMHSELSGLWDLYEMGGSGPDVWDRIVSSDFNAGRYLSPIEAMRGARKDFNEEMARIDAWEEEMEMMTAMEREQQRERERVLKGQEKGRIG